MKDVLRYYGLKGLARIGLLASISIAGFGKAGAEDLFPDLPSLAPFLENSPITTASGITFLNKKTRLWLGRSQVICFYTKQVKDEDDYFSFAADEKFLHVMMPPHLNPGSHLGYIRIKPIQEGHTEISLEGATLELEIVKDVESSTLEITRPDIVSPAQGSVVWGKFVVAVERLNFSTLPHPPAPRLRLPNGEEIEADKIPDQQPGPHLRYAFTVEAKSLQPGSNELVAVVKGEDDHEISSKPLDLIALEPRAETLLTGNCKDQIKTQLPPSKVPGANSYLISPEVVEDEQSTYNSIISISGDNAPWCMPVDVPALGLYQLMVTARGDIGGNALPTVALMIDDAQNAATTARLATTKWHRVPVGHPFKLEAGSHVLSVRFRNGFSSGPVDNRHLYLARYELARLDELPKSSQPDDPVNITMQDAGATPFNQKPSMTPESSMADTPNMMMTKPASESMMQALLPLGNLHLVFKEALDGQIISNQVQINALAWWPNREHSPPPQVELWIDDHLAASVTSPRPNFKMDVGAFRPGKNKIELRGVLPNGRRARSVAETVILPKELSLGVEPYRPYYRFFVHDQAWKGSLEKLVDKNEADSIAEFARNGDADLSLPVSLHGPYKISIEARGTDFKGPAIATLLLKQRGQESKLGEVTVGGGMAVIYVAEKEFEQGPKTLVVRYANDAYEEGKGDRNLFVRSLLLDPKYPLNKTLPLASIAYPKPGAKIDLADAVVGQVCGINGVVKADLVIDGQPQHFNLSAPNGLGPILFPLLTRGLASGVHQIQINARDEAGNSSQSAPVAIDVTGQPNQVTSSYSQAVQLLNRFGYGAEPRELVAILTQGNHNWLEERLNQNVNSASEENERERLQAEFPESYGVASRAIQYLITEPNPVRARFLMWVENHFSTWVNKDGPEEKSREHDRFMELGLAPFSDLLLASATSPAMLIYLDQRYSVARRLNENYAREIMELHTLGVKGGYTQQDVTTLADLLTGWSLADEAPRDGSSNLEKTFRYNPYLNSGSACRILGMDFPGVTLDRRFDRVVSAINLLSAHPSCAVFISRKLAEHYVSDPAPPELVNDLARVYLESGGDMRRMMLALSEEPGFWAAPEKVASPLDFGIRLARMSGLGNPYPVNELISRSGMGMFDRATPDGYPEADGYYTSSNALLQRWHFAQTIQNSFLVHGLIPNEWVPQNHQWTPAITQRLIDLVAVRITGNVLTTSSNEAALHLISSAPENTEARLHLLTTFLCQIPETSLR